MKTSTLKKLLPFIALMSDYLIQPYSSYAQCTTAAPAIASCSGGNGAVHNGANINFGQTYWYSSNGTLAGVNMGGGTLRVCGTLTLSSINFNSGTIIVENGGGLVINNPSELQLSGLCFIVNRGSFVVNAGLQMRNLFNIIWNDNSAAVFTVNGTLNINSSSSYIINKGILKATSLVIQNNADENSVCMRENAIMNIGSLTTNASNAVSYSGIGSPGCVSIGGTYILNRPFTASSSIAVCKTTGSSSGGSENWGSAIVSSGCSGCSAALPVHISSFGGARQGNGINLQWTIADNADGSELFAVEKSADGLHFTTIASIPAQKDKKNYSYYDASITGAEQYYRIRQSGQSASATYSPVELVKTGSNEHVNIYPNPLVENNTVFIELNIPASETVQLLLTDAAGKILFIKKESLNRGKNIINWKLSGVPGGIYIIRLQSTSLGNIYKRIAIVEVK
jgi:hypothetical protein